jgi:hypothetical protein
MLRHQPTPFKPQSAFRRNTVPHLYAALWGWWVDRKRYPAQLPPLIWRNYASELERELDICLERLEEKNLMVSGRMRYRFACRGDVLKVIQFVNHMAAVNQHHGLSKQDIADILNLYPDNFTAA